MEIKTVRGARDLLPGQTARWQKVEATARDVFARYGYGEIRLPVFEHTELFVRGIGEGTDIVSKEMYTFDDRKGRSMTLRPEGTASVVRSYLEHNLGRGEHGEAKLYYMGPMFRYERPQAGRYRQFYQVGAECIGVEDPDAVAEVIAMLVRFLGESGLKNVSVSLNSVGDETCRPVYRKALVAHLEANRDQLSADSLNRIQANPMRVLDSKDPQDRPVIEAAPKMGDFLDKDCADHFAAVRSYLEGFGITPKLDPTLVRGLDYYTRTVFEIQSGGLGAQNAVCGGGRYDGLIGSFSKQDRPAVGFAVGLDRLMMLLEEGSAEQSGDAEVDVAVVVLGSQAKPAALALAENIRRSGKRVYLEIKGVRGAKAQFKRAAQLGASAAVILGEDEVKNGKATVKNFINEEQETVDFSRALDKVLDVVRLNEENA
jgi:histidyl-tRNA synthetase